MIQNKIAFVTATITMFFSLIISHNSYGQVQRPDSLRRELTVVSDHEAFIDKQQPLQPAYQFDKPKVTKLRPTPPKPTGDFTPSIVIPRHPALSDKALQRNEGNKIGFVSLSGGLGPNISADAGLNLPLGNYSSLLLDALHRSSWNWPTYGNGTRSKFVRHVTDVSLGYLYSKPATNFKIDGEIAHDNYNFFGVHYPALSPTTQVGSRLTSPHTASELFGAINSNLQWENENNAIALVASFDINNKKGRSPNEEWVKGGRALNFDLNGTYSHTFGSLWRAGIKLRTSVNDFLGAANNNEGMNLLKEENVNNSFFYHSELLTPFIGLHGNIGKYPWYVNVGANLGFQRFESDYSRFPINGKSNKPFVVTPYFDTHIVFSDKVGLFALVDAFSHMPDRFGDNLYNRYVALGYAFHPEFIPLHTELGVEVNAGYGISFTLSGGYDRVKNKNFLAPRLINTESNVFVAFKPYLNDANLYYGKLAFHYNLYNKLRIDGNVTYNYYAVQNSLPEGIVPLEAGLYAVYNPIEKVSLFADFFLGAGVQHYNPLLTGTTEKPLTFGRILLGGNYWLNSFIAINASLGNSCFIIRSFPYDYHDRYPLTFQIGASILF